MDGPGPIVVVFATEIEIDSFQNVVNKSGESGTKHSTDRNSNRYDWLYFVWIFAFHLNQFH